MRITESQLRRIIREEIIGEAPLDDIITYDVNLRQPRVRSPSVAHPRSRSRYKRVSGKSYMDIARDLMRSTKDNWVIITPSDTGRIKLTLDSARFKEWLEEKRKQHPAGTIFALVGIAPLDNDFRTPEWSVIHDLFGHALEEEFGRRRPQMTSIPDELVWALHRSLPRELQISKSRKDQLPDVLAAILLGDLTHDAAHQVAEDYVAELPPADSEDGSHFEDQLREHSELIDSMFAAVDEFVEDARAAGFVELKPW